MILKNLYLQNFRSYSKAEFSFSPSATIIVGPNAIGKTNLIEAVYLLSAGKSFKTDKDRQIIKLGQNVCRLKGSLEETKEVEGTEELEIVFAESATQFIQKKYLVNGVSKRRADFAGRIPVVLFTPVDLDIVAGQPGVRRKYLDEILEQTDHEYRTAHVAYTKALRQRNALLEEVQETGRRDEERFSYWDNLIIKNGQMITKKREELIAYINNRDKEIFEFSLAYDKSVISEERLLQYKQAEMGAGVTLVGPHRDDMLINAFNKLSKTNEEVKYFGSRGQQRLVSLELKLSHIAVIKERTDTQPVLLLDDVFSELDSSNIGHVLDLMNTYQTITTTTHKEFIGNHSLKNMKVIELGR